MTYGDQEKSMYTYSGAGIMWYLNLWLNLIQTLERNSQWGKYIFI